MFQFLQILEQQKQKHKKKIQGHHHLRAVNHTSARKRVKTRNLPSKKRKTVERNLGENTQKRPCNPHKKWSSFFCPGRVVCNSAIFRVEKCDHMALSQWEKIHKITAPSYLPKPQSRLHW